MATIRKLKSGRYNVQLRREGHPPLTGMFPNKTEAKAWATKIEDDINQGRHYGLTLHEMRVAILAANGMTDEQVGEKIARSKKTVRYYVNSALQKLRVGSSKRLALMIIGGVGTLAKVTSKKARDMAPSTEKPPLKLLQSGRRDAAAGSRS